MLLKLKQVTTIYRIMKLVSDILVLTQTGVLQHDDGVCIFWDRYTNALSRLNVQIDLRPEYIFNASSHCVQLSISFCDCYIVTNTKSLSTL